MKKIILLLESNRNPNIKPSSLAVLFFSELEELDKKEMDLLLELYNRVNSKK